MGAVLTPRIYIAWIPMGEEVLRPLLFGAYLPSPQKVKADMLRRTGNSLDVCADTKREVGKSAHSSTDVRRTLISWNQADGDVLRSLGIFQSISGNTFRNVGTNQGIGSDSLRTVVWPECAFLRPSLYISAIRMGSEVLNPSVFATVIPSSRKSVRIHWDMRRRVAYSNLIPADTCRRAVCCKPAIADTIRNIYSPFIERVSTDLLRQLILPNTVLADTARVLGGVWAAVCADTSRILSPYYCVCHADTFRSAMSVDCTSGDTRRVRGIANMVAADTFRKVGWGEPSIAAVLRAVVKYETVLADTSIRIPHVLEYVDRNPVSVSPIRIRMAGNSSFSILQNFHEHGIRSFSMTLGELTLSDTFQLETVQPMSIDDAVQGQILDYRFHFLVEETVQRDLVQSVKGMYSKDKLLYTAISIFVEEANVSYYAQEISNALGLKLHMACDDFIPSQDYQDSGMTYQDFISSLFGWTSKLPQRQINVFIRGDTLHIIQRGLEESMVDITDWPHSRPTIERKLVRSVWHGFDSDSGDSKAHNEDSDPVPFTGTISFEDISYTYVDGYLIHEKNESGETEYSYQNEYDHQGNLTGKYVSRKETKNMDGSVSEVNFVYAATATDIYLFKERERSRYPRETDTYMDEWDSERITYHAPIGYGWYATTVYEDGERVGSSISQGKSGGKASRFTIDQSNLSLGSHYFSDDEEDEARHRYTSLIDTEFPVKDENYLLILTQAIEWLNRRTQETVTLEIHANIHNGVPDVNHIVDFTERIRFEENEYFLMSNAVELTPRSLKQTIRMTRWY